MISENHRASPSIRCGSKWAPGNGLFLLNRSGFNGGFFCNHAHNCNSHRPGVTQRLLPCPPQYSFPRTHHLWSSSTHLSLINDYLGTLNIIFLHIVSNSPLFAMGCQFNQVVTKRNIFLRCKIDHLRPSFNTIYSTQFTFIISSKCATVPKITLPAEHFHFTL